ncbi:hypothetical protein TorRG33x02_124870 [Trema orientale]|uniref:Uncharacterized protein n=1 Tax=Trema orientale TaxID=63057 RepID=A0A2P5F1I6_TREOI|nr:hypothetical protein TorRG33x02_124870 [Trema orientale]
MREILDIVYRSIQTTTDEDAVKLALLYFLGLRLLSNAKSALVPEDLFHCIITEIKPTEGESNELREKGLIASEKASLKRKLVVEEETEICQEKDDDMIEVHNIHPSKCQKVKLGATATECGFYEIVLQKLEHIREEIARVNTQQFNLTQMMCFVIDMVQSIGTGSRHVDNVNVYEFRPRPKTTPYAKDNDQCQPDF